MDQLVSVPVARAMVRPDLMAGCERRLFLLVGLIAAMLVLGAQTPVSAVTGVVFWVVSVGGLRRAAKADPELSSVYMRHIRYRPYYAPAATPWALSAQHRRDQ